MLRKDDLQMTTNDGRWLEGTEDEKLYKCPLHNIYLNQNDEYSYEQTVGLIVCTIDCIQLKTTKTVKPIKSIHFSELVFVDDQCLYVVCCALL